MKKYIAIFAFVLLVLSSSVFAADFELTAIHAIVDGKTDILTEGETIEVRQESKLEIVAFFDNNYLEEDEIEVDAEIDGLIDGIDKGGDLKDDGDANINPEDSGKASMEFRIPPLTYDDNYNLEINIDAQADNGESYSWAYVHRLKIIKPEDELKISNVALSKEVIGCDDTSIAVSFDILNSGGRVERDLKYIISIIGTEVYVERPNQVIEEGNEFPVSENLDIGNLPEGLYYIYIDAYCNEDETSVRRSVPLKKDCSAKSAASTTSTSQQYTPPSSTSYTTIQTTSTASQPTQAAQATTSQQVNRKGTSIVVKENGIDNKISILLIVNVSILVAGIITFLVVSYINKI